MKKTILTLFAFTLTFLIFKMPNSYANNYDFDSPAFPLFSGNYFGGFRTYYYPITDNINSTNVCFVNNDGWYYYDGSDFLSLPSVDYMYYTETNPTLFWNNTKFAVYVPPTARELMDFTDISFSVPFGDSPMLPSTPNIDNGLGYDISLSHTEFNIPLSNDFWEFVSVKGAWNYPTVEKLSFELYINGEKRDSINLLNNFTTNFGVAFNFFTSHYNAIIGDVVRILCTPIGEDSQGLARGIEWTIGSKENITISKIPNTTPKVDINNVPYTPTIQKEKQFIYNPITNEYVTNNYYTQNYENPDLSNIESQLDYILDYIDNNSISSGAETPQTIINYNTTNKNYNLDFGNIDFGDIDVDFEIGNAEEHVKQSFDDFITNIQLLMNSPFEKIVIAFGVGIGLLLLVLAIVIVAKILNIIIP